MLSWGNYQHKQVLYQRASGEMAQVITEEQKTLMIWLVIDCACYCLRVFGSHPQGSRTGKLNDSLGMCLYFWRVVLLCLQRTLKLYIFLIPGDLHDCCWFTKLYFILCEQFVYWLYDQIYKLKELCGGQMRFPTRIIIFISGNESAASHWA